jgi:hypothetical protein
VTHEGSLKFLSYFPDNVFDINSRLSLFEFYKQSVEKQRSMRSVVTGIIHETNNHMILYN